MYYEYLGVVIHVKMLEKLTGRGDGLFLKILKI
jgi:hypothetical protein